MRCCKKQKERQSEYHDDQSSRQDFLSVAISGQDHAPVIVFSNSLGTDQGMWQLQVAAFEQQFKVVTYDTRGHGQSDVIEQTTVQNLAEDVIDILDGLNIEKAHFCGISMGGMTALWLGIHHADRFHSITVANSSSQNLDRRRMECACRCCD